MVKMILVLFALLAVVLPLSAQNDSISEAYSVVDTLSNNFGLFTNDEIIELSIRFDITHYMRKKPKEEYLNALLTYHFNDNDSVNKEIRLKSRGEFRNGYCSFPPVMINFKKTEFKKDDLNKIEKMKLVTHCKSGNEDLLLKEYLAYKLFNVLTDSSFRVRLLKITYINTYKKSKPVTTFGFFIEPLDLVADRIKAVPVEAVNLSQKNILPEYMDRMAIFFYMIGNSDWSVPNQHNCKILSVPGSAHPELGMVIPYDFDYSGLINAEYAVPPEGLGITSVRERIFLGVCRDEESFRRSIREFADKKDAFYRVIRDFPYIDEKIEKEMVRYLDEFFSEIENDRIVYNFRNECKSL